MSDPESDLRLSRCDWKYHIHTTVWVDDAHVDLDCTYFDSAHLDLDLDGVHFDLDGAHFDLDSIHLDFDLDIDNAHARDSVAAHI